MEQRTFSKDQVIFRQGEYSDACMYDIAEGKVGIYLNYGTEDEKKLTVLEAGGYVGEMGLLESRARSATAVALADPTVLNLITVETFADYLQNHEDKVVAIMRQLSGRIRGLTDDYMEVCHTLAENLEAEKKGKSKGGWILEQLKKFAEAYMSMNVGQ